MPKSQESYSYLNLSFVRRRHCHRCHCLFIFKSYERRLIAILRFFVIIIIILLPTFFVQSFSLRPLHGSSWIFTIRRDSKSTSKNKVFSAWKLVVSMETWKLRFSEHNFNCLVQGQFPTNFGIRCRNGRPWKNILSMGTRSHVTSCHGNNEDFCWILYFVPLWANVLRIPYQIFWITSWQYDLQHFGNFGFFSSKFWFPWKPEYYFSLILE